MNELVSKISSSRSSQRSSQKKKLCSKNRLSKENSKNDRILKDSLDSDKISKEIIKNSVDSLDQWKTPIKDKNSINKGSTAIEYSTNEKNSDFKKRVEAQIKEFNYKCEKQINHSEMQRKKTTPIENLSRFEFGDIVEERVFDNSSYYLAVYDDLINPAKFAKFIGKPGKVFNTVSFILKDFTVLYYSNGNKLKCDLTEKKNSMSFLTLFLLKVDEINLFLSKILKTIINLNADLLDFNTKLGETLELENKSKSNLTNLGSIFNIQIFALRDNKNQIKFDSNEKIYIQNLLNHAENLYNQFPEFSKEYMIKHVYSNSEISKKIELADFLDYEVKIKKKDDSSLIEKQYDVGKHKFTQNRLIAHGKIKQSSITTNDITDKSDILRDKSNPNNFNNIYVEDELRINGSLNNQTLKKIAYNSNMSQFVLKKKQQVPTTTTKNIFVVSRDKKINFDQINESSSSSSFYMEHKGVNEVYQTPKKSKL